VLAINRSDRVTVSGDISGTGGLTQMGPGTTILTGTNAYSGPTTILAGLLQIGNGGVAGTLGNGSVVNLGGLAINVSGPITIAGSISGTGTVTQSGPGTLILTGMNTYTGTTTISAGTLQVGNGGTTGQLGAGAVVNNGALLFNRSGDVIASGAISGTGSLTQAGPGTMILTADNTYTGGTTISAGTLQIGDGGTTGSLLGDVVNHVNLAFNRSDSLTFPGVVSGSGSLTQAGTGTTILTGANTLRGWDADHGGHAAGGRWGHQRPTR
jgi:autotransporter-associated beta strand protein